MSKFLIIGYGNPFRSDDGLGWHAAVHLSETLHEPDVEIQACQQLTPELAEPISRASRVLFIDASHGSSPGEICLNRLQPKRGSPSLLAHHVQPGVLLGYVGSFYHTEPEAMVLSVTGQTFDYGSELSKTSSTAVDQVEKVVRKWIRQGGQCHA